MPARHIKRTSGSTARGGGSSGLGMLLAALVCIGLGVGAGYLAFSGPKKPDADQEQVSKEEMKKFGNKRYKEGVNKGLEIEREKSDKRVQQAVDKELARQALQHRKDKKELRTQIEEAGKATERELQKAHEAEITEIKNAHKTEIADLKTKIEEIRNASPEPMVLVLPNGVMAVLNPSAKQEISEIKISVAKTSGEKYVHYIYNIAPGKLVTFKVSELKHKNKFLAGISENDGSEFSIKYNYDNGEYQTKTVEPVFTAKSRN